MALVQRVGRAPRVVVRDDHAAAGDVEAVHDDEAARRGDLVDGVKGDRLLRPQRQFGGLVTADKGLGCRALDGLEGGGVNHPFQLLDVALDFLRGELEPVFPARHERLFAQPEDAGLEAGERVGRRVLRRGNGPALDKDLVGERDPDAFAGLGEVARGSVPALDGLHRAGLVAGGEDQPVADLDAAALDAPGQDAPVVEAIHVLNREPQGLVAERPGGFELVERLHHRRPLPPGHVLAGRGDVVAFPGGDGNEAARLEAELREPGAILGLDGVEPLLRVAHQVHLVDQHGDLADAQQVEQVAVAPGVFLHALMGVNHQQRRLGLRGAGDHVLDELLVPRRVNDHVAPLLRMEPDLRGINADILVALGLERVHQVRPFEGDAAALGDLLELLQLAFGQRAGVVQEAAHQGGLAVVHVAEDDDLELLGGLPAASGIGG